MLLYNGPFLKINYEKEHKRFVLSWEKSPSTKNQFKDEILNYVRLLKQHTFHQILWLQSNFKFEMDDDCKEWFDKTVHGIKTNKSWLTRDSLGYHHLYFVVGENVLAQIEVLKIFKKQLKTKIKPRYFTTKAISFFFHFQLFVLHLPLLVLFKLQKSTEIGLNLKNMNR